MSTEPLRRPRLDTDVALPLLEARCVATGVRSRGGVEDATAGRLDMVATLARRLLRGSPSRPRG